MTHTYRVPLGCERHLSLFDQVILKLVRSTVGQGHHADMRSQHVQMLHSSTCCCHCSAAVSQACALTACVLPCRFGPGGVLFARHAEVPDAGPTVGPLWSHLHNRYRLTNQDMVRSVSATYKHMPSAYQQCTAVPVMCMGTLAEALLTSKLLGVVSEAA